MKKKQLLLLAINISTVCQPIFAKEGSETFITPLEHRLTESMTICEGLTPTKCLNFNLNAASYDAHNAAVMAHFSKLAYKTKTEIEDEFHRIAWEKPIYVEVNGKAFFAVQKRDVVIFSFRGTVPTANNILADLTLVFDGNKNAHAGFVAAFDSLKSAFLSVLKYYNALCGDRMKLWFTGHSLGGAIATIAAYHVALDLKRPVNTVYTFGSPRTMSATEIEKLVTKVPQFYRVIHSMDPVTMVPSALQGYKHTPNSIKYERKTCARTTYNLDNSAWSLLWDSVRISPWVSDHALKNYIVCTVRDAI